MVSGYGQQTNAPKSGVSGKKKGVSVEAEAREEARSEESLSISQKALDNSRLATRISISAIVLSIIVAMLEVIRWYSQ